MSRSARAHLTGIQDRKHELAILDRQMEQMRLGYTHRLEEIAVEADIAES